MHYTIGDIVNIILPYSNDINIKVMNGMPFLKASIKDVSKFTKFWIYVIQLKDYTYSVCESHDDVFNRYYPSGIIDKPFITETDLIRKIFNLDTNNDISYMYDKVISDLDLDGFFIYFIKRLYRNKIIRFNLKNLDTRLINLGFTSPRILRVIDRPFEVRNIKNGTILDLLDIVVKRNEDFSLGKLKEKEIRVIEIKLKELGLRPHINHTNNSINNITFELRKGE